MAKCIIVDLDNTIADTKHRAHHLDKRPKDWDSFNRDCVYDTPMTHIIELITAMKERGYIIVIFSGREATVRLQTEIWLAQHGVKFDCFYMRQKGDYTEDSELKERWLDKYIIDAGLDPLFVLDDRNRVVAMWRRRGIPCLQVQEGDF